MRPANAAPFAHPALTAFAALAALLLPAAASAQQGPSPEAGAAQSNGAPLQLTGTGRGVRTREEREHGPDEYNGLTLGAAHLPRGFARRLRRGARPVVTWPGFQMTQDGSRLFFAVSGTNLQIDAPQSANGRVVYRLHNASIYLHNTRRPLETGGFATPVERAYVRQARRDVELVVELRAQSQGNLTQQQGPDGVTFVLLDFPRYAAAEGVGVAVDSPAARTLQPRERNRRPANGTNAPAGSSNDNGAPSQPPSRGSVEIRPSQDPPPQGSAMDNERPPPVRP